MRGDGLAPVLQGDLRHRAIHEGEQGLLDDDVESAARRARRLDLVRQRRDDSIGDENPREGADQRRADQAAEDFGRLIQRRHRVDDAEHRRDDADRRQGVGDRGQRMIGLQLVVGDRLQLLVHQRLDLMRAGIADDDQAAIIADEACEVGVGENFREILEDRQFFRIIHMLLDLAARLAAQFPHQSIKHAENVEIVPLRGPLVEDRLYNGRAGVLDCRERVRNDECAEGDADDDDELPWLEYYCEMAAHRGEAAEHATERHDQTDYERQGLTSCRRCLAEIIKRPALLQAEFQAANSMKVNSCGATAHGQKRRGRIFLRGSQPYGGILACPL